MAENVKKKIPAVVTETMRPEVEVRAGRTSTLTSGA